ncbi:MAG: HAD family hydrolase [Clostridiales bacterium]|nr:HAD family hydrolase [Clostridiales bacterium]
MSITTILFDLDGTLLPMDLDVFTDAYLKDLAMTAAPAGYEPKAFYKAVITGTYAMVKNDGSKTNEEVFWDAVADIFGDKIKHDIHIFDEYYRTGFQKIRSVCGYTPKAKELINRIKAKGYRVVLATNPLFPAAATESRIRWAGLEPSDFEIYTTYEYAHYCKPNPQYYQEILNKLQLTPEECLMVGNDVSDDMAAKQLGMKVFLLTDCLINKYGADISVYPHGSYDELNTFIDGLGDNIK